MSETVTGVVVAAVVIVVGLVTFHLMVSTWEGQNSDVRAVLEAQDQRLNTSIGLASASAGDLDCDTFTGALTNAGNTSVAEFSLMDVMVEYTDATDAKVYRHAEISWVSRNAFSKHEVRRNRATVPSPPERL